MAKRTMIYGQAQPEVDEQDVPQAPSAGGQTAQGASSPHMATLRGGPAPSPAQLASHAAAREERPTHTGAAGHQGPPWFETPFLVYALCALVFPLGLYGLWKNSQMSQERKWAVAAITLLVWGAILSSGGDEAGGSSGGGGSDCSTTYTRDGCTYYRDSTCNVIARDCN